MTINQKALDPQGYIVDQRETADISFGGTPSNKNGCGWIAAYNFLKAMDQQPDPEAVLRSLEKTLLPGGKLGLNFFALVWYLKKQHIPLEASVTSFHAQQISERCKAGIILYRAGKTNHFAAFRREENGLLRFYGAIAGKQCHDISMAGFYWNHVKFPLAVTITASN